MSSQLGSEIGVRIFAETGELKPGMDSAANDVERSAARMQDAIGRLKEDIGGHMSKITGTVKASNDDIAGSFSSMTTTFGKLGGLIAGVFAVIAGNKLATAAKETADYTEEAMSLGRAMGTTATKASIWIEVAKELGSTTGEVEGAARGLTKQLKTNEDGLNRLGLVTRDANGDLLDMDTLMKSAIATVNEHKEGTDRNMAAQEIFGRAVSGNSKLLLANAEAFQQDEEYIRSLGGQVSGEAVAAWELYDAAMDKVEMGMTAFRNTIGNEVMPVIAKLAEWLSNLIPAAITVTKGALGGLVSAFWLVKNGVVVVWETINAMVVSVAEPIRALSAAIGKALTGDFEGAAAELKGIGGTISGAWSQAMDEMLKSSEETNTRIAAIFGAPTDVAKEDSSGKNYQAAPDKEKKGKADKVESRLPAWEAELSQQKAAFMLSNDMYEMSVENEKKYWDDLLKTLDRGDKEYGAVRKKSADLELKILKEQATQGRAIKQEEIEEWKKSSLDSIALQQEEAQMSYDMGATSYAELLQQEIQFEQQRYEINRDAIVERLALLQKDPNMNPVEYQKLKNQILEIDRKHVKDKKAIEGAIKLDDTKPMLKVFDTMKSSFSSALTGMLTGAMNWRQALRGIFSSLLNSFVESLVTPMLMNWAMSLLRQTTLYQAFFATKATQDATAATTTAATNTAEAMSAAGLAGANATASAAAIPIVGWAMAPEAGAAVYAVAAGFAATASASGGYDVPSGVNPITQLHQEEMVLPAHIANPLRQNLADGGGMGSGAGGIHIHVNSASPKDMIRSLKDGGALHKVLKDYERRFVR